MIVAMKKAVVIVRAQDAEACVKSLRGLGLLHVEHQRQPQGKDILALQDEIALVNAALDVLMQAESLGKSGIVQQDSAADWHTLARHLIDLWKRHEQLDAYSRNLAVTITEWEKWGDFDPGQFQQLAGKGIFAALFSVPVKELGTLPENAVVKTIFTAEGFAHCTVFSRQKIELPFQEIALPKQGLAHMRQRFLEDEKVKKSLMQQIRGHAGFSRELLEIKKGLEKKIEFQQAVRGMAEEGALAYIAGYVPSDETEKVSSEARQKQWGLLIRDPAEEDPVPTLLRNPRWVSIISPLFGFLEILPGYHELDISLPFLIFFSIFFGMLIGDAGYGLVYFAITAWVQKKAKGRGQGSRSFFLFYILSSCAIIWGLLTGTFFGQEWFLKAGYKPLLPVLNDEKGIQRFCFFLGAFHLSIAHAWRAVLKFPSLDALADVGWMCVLWAAFFMARMLILDDVFPFFGTWLIIAGLMLVILFTNPQKNVLKAIGAGLGTVALGLMNNFTDVVSYVRLFAVGLAGVAIADAFNSMAGLLGQGNIFALAASVFIVVLGHTLGLVLGPVSVLVHGVRLNVLEFSGHANVTWSGVSYSPLQE